MEDLWRTRPPAVTQALTAKFSRLNSVSPSAEPVWTNMGHENVKVFYTLAGAYIELDDLLHHYVVLRQGRMLDLGTAQGSLLLYMHERWSLPWHNLLGVSAYDHRPKEGKSSANIPDESYIVANIDNLAEDEARLCQGGKFTFIWSACTFYHLVDPVGTLGVVYDMLAMDGLAIIQHVPLRGSLHADVSGATAEQVEEEAQYLQKSLQRLGFRAVVLETVDKPGFCMIALLKEERSPRKLQLPYCYSGDLHSVGGEGDLESSAYVWAGLNRVGLSDTSQREGGHLSRTGFFESLGVPIKVLRPPVVLETTRKTLSKRCILL